MEKPAKNSADVTMRDRDLLFAGLLIFGSIALILYAWGISREAMQAVEATFYDAPGFSLIVIGLGLLILGGALLKIALSEGGTLRWLNPGPWWHALRKTSTLKTLVAFFYLFVYMFGLGQPLPGSGVVIPFWALTFLFLVAMMATFRAASLVRIIVIGGLCSLLVTWLFGTFAQIPLP